MANLVAEAQAVTARAFSKGSVPAPFYLHVLAQAQARAMRASVAVAPGTANPHTAGGTVYVQRHTAAHKLLPGATYAPYTPAATRRQWVTRTVRVRTHAHGWRNVVVTNQASVPVI